MSALGLTKTLKIASIMAVFGRFMAVFNRFLARNPA
jgi:hypothetical protein